MTPMFRRHQSPDALRPAAKMTEDRRAHPVVQTILRRRDEGSRPGARSDGRRVALVIEGGGLRGVVSAGMTAAIEQLGLCDAFDEVHGSSAGAFNGAFLLAGQAAYLAALYPEGFGDPKYVSLARPLRGGPVFDMDYVIDRVWTRYRRLRFDAIAASGIDGRRAARASQVGASQRGQLRTSYRVDGLHRPGSGGSQGPACVPSRRGRPAKQRRRSAAR